MGTASSQPIKQPMLPPVGLVEPDKVSRPTNDHYQILAHPECDAPARFQTEVEKLKEQFHSLDKEVRAAGKLVVRGIAQMIPALAKMEPFLSRKGEHHEPHYVKMLVAAGLPTWEDYKKQVAADFEISVRTVQRKLAEHRGEPKEIQPRRLSSGSPSVTRKARPDPAQNAAVATAARLLAEAKEQFGKAADGGSEQAKAVIAQYEKEYAATLAAGAGEKTLKAEQTTPDAHKEFALLLWRQHLLLCQLAGGLWTLESCIERWSQEQSEKYIKGLSAQVQAFRVRMKDVVEFKTIAGLNWVSFKQADGSRIECRVNDEGCGASGKDPVCDKVRRVKAK